MKEIKERSNNFSSLDEKYLNNIKKCIEKAADECLCSCKYEFPPPYSGGYERYSKYLMNGPLDGAHITFKPPNIFIIIWNNNNYDDKLVKIELSKTVIDEIKSFIDDGDSDIYYARDILEDILKQIEN